MNFLRFSVCRTEKMVANLYANVNASNSTNIFTNEICIKWRQTKYTKYKIDKNRDRKRRQKYFHQKKKKTRKTFNKIVAEFEDFFFWSMFNIVNWMKTLSLHLTLFFFCIQICCFSHSHLEPLEKTNEKIVANCFFYEALNIYCEFSSSTSSQCI